MNKALEPFRAIKNKSVDARVTLIHAPDDAILKAFADELADLFIVSGVTLTDAPKAADGSYAVDVKVELHPGPRCERCWKHFDKLAAEPNDVCGRCATALAGLKA